MAVSAKKLGSPETGKIVSENPFAGVTDMKNKSSIQMFVAYDNNPADKGLETDWGFSSKSLSTGDFKR
jgi:hypothetical protein